MQVQQNQWEIKFSGGQISCMVKKSAYCTLVWLLHDGTAWKLQSHPTKFAPLLEFSASKDWSSKNCTCVNTKSVLLTNDIVALLAKNQVIGALGSIKAELLTFVGSPKICSKIFFLSMTRLIIHWISKTVITWAFPYKSRKAIGLCGKSVVILQRSNMRLDNSHLWLCNQKCMHSADWRALTLQELCWTSAETLLLPCMRFCSLPGCCT